MKAEKFNRLLGSMESDFEAFEKIYSYYYKRVVYRLCQFYRRAIAEDAAQEFFQKLYRMTRIEYVKDPAEWLYSSCSVIAEKLTAEEERNVEYDEKNLGKEGITYMKTTNEFEEMLKILPNETDRRIMRLHILYGYTQKHISEQMGINYDAVRQRITRAKQKIKEHEASEAQRNKGQVLAYGREEE